MAITDLEGKVLYVNQAFAKLTGWAVHPESCTSRSYFFVDLSNSTYSDFMSFVSSYVVIGNAK